MNNTQIDWQVTIIAYLMKKLNVPGKWYIESNDFLFGQSPQDLVMSGNGQFIIEFLEERAGLRNGEAF